MSIDNITVQEWNKMGFKTIKDRRLLMLLTMSLTTTHCTETTSTTTYTGQSITTLAA